MPKSAQVEEIDADAGVYRLSTSVVLFGITIGLGVLVKKDSRPDPSVVVYERHLPRWPWEPKVVCGYDICIEVDDEIVTYQHIANPGCVYRTRPRWEAIAIKGTQ